MKKISLVVIAAAFVFLLSGCKSGSTSESVQMSGEAGSVAETEHTDGPENKEEVGEPSEEEIQEEYEAEGEDVRPAAAEEEPEAAAAPDEKEQDFAGMEIEVSEGNLYIRSGESFSLTRHNGKTVDYEIREGTLYFETDRPEDVVLVLPEGESYETLELIVKHGHVYMENTFTVQQLNLEVKQGEASLSDILVSDDSYINVSGGSASIYGDLGSSVTAVCNQGNINMGMTFEETDCNYEVEISGGNIHLGKKDYHGKSYSDSIDNGAERSMSLRCSHGDISVTF